MPGFPLEGERFLPLGSWLEFIREVKSEQFQMALAKVYSPFFLCEIVNYSLLSKHRKGLFSGVPAFLRQCSQ